MTMAEVMIALAVLTIAVFGLIGARSYALRARSVSVERRQAVMLAATALEDAERTLRHEFSRDVTWGPAPHSQAPQYEMEISQDANYDSSAKLKRVEVRMSWKDRNGSQSHKVWTVMYDRSR